MEFGSNTTDKFKKSYEAQQNLKFDPNTAMEANHFFHINLPPEQYMGQILTPCSRQNSVCASVCVSSSFLDEIDLEFNQFSISDLQTKTMFVLFYSPTPPSPSPFTQTRILEEFITFIFFLIGIGLVIFRMKKIEIYRHHDTIL